MTGRDQYSGASTRPSTISTISVDNGFSRMTTARTSDTSISGKVHRNTTRNAHAGVRGPPGQLCGQDGAEDGRTGGPTDALAGATTECLAWAATASL